MALIVITKEEAAKTISKMIAEHKNVLIFEDAKGIQAEFCHRIELDNHFAESKKFFHIPEVKEYLDSIGLRVDDNYRAFSDEWVGIGRFITFLNYYVQAACLMLAYDKIDYFFANDYIAIDPKYSAYVLKKKDVYFVDDENYPISSCKLHDFYKNGVDIIYKGVRYNAGDPNGLVGLTDLEYDDRFLSRELDAEVFPADFSERIEYPQLMSLARFVNQKNDDWFDTSDYEGIDILVKGSFGCDGDYRRYPIHQFYKIGGKWYYYDCNSVKYPERYEIIDDAFLCKTVFDFSIQKELDVSNATEVFSLVLDCNETCNARKYWDHVAFVGKYNKRDKLITILDKNQGILEFHNILQSSEDLSQDVVPVVEDE